MKKLAQTVMNRQIHTLTLVWLAIRESTMQSRVAWELRTQSIECINSVLKEIAEAKERAIVQTQSALDIALENINEVSDVLTSASRNAPPEIGAQVERLATAFRKQKQTAPSQLTEYEKQRLNSIGDFFDMFMEKYKTLLKQFEELRC